MFSNFKKTKDKEPPPLSHALYIKAFFDSFYFVLLQETRPKNSLFKSNNTELPTKNETVKTTQKSKYMTI